MASDTNSEANGLNGIKQELEKDDEELKSDQALVDLAQMTGTQLADARRMASSCDVLRQHAFGELTKDQKKILKDEEHSNEVKLKFKYEKQLHTYGKSGKSKQGKNIACCGHLCIHGELHWFCHKCQVFSRFRPCCLQTLVPGCSSRGAW